MKRNFEYFVQVLAKKNEMIVSISDIDLVGYNIYEISIEGCGSENCKTILNSKRILSYDI